MVSENHKFHTLAHLLLPARAHSHYTENYKYRVIQTDSSIQTSDRGTESTAVTSVKENQQVTRKRQLCARHLGISLEIW